MSDTPRMDAANETDPGTGAIDRQRFALYQAGCLLERDLAAANERADRAEAKHQVCEMGHAYLANSHEYPCPWCENARLRTEVRVLTQEVKQYEAALADCQARLSRRVQEVEQYKSLDAGHMSRIDGLKTRVELLTAEVKRLTREVERLTRENETLKRGIYENAYEIGNLGPQCSHKNNLYAHCLACEVERLTRERDAYRRAKQENDERYMTERDEARRERDEVVALLRKLEWAGKTLRNAEFTHYCPCCGNYRDANKREHLPGCEMAVLLARIGRA